MAALELLGPDHLRVARVQGRHRFPASASTGRPVRSGDPRLRHVASPDGWVRLLIRVQDRAPAAGYLHGQPPSLPPVGGHLGCRPARRPADESRL